MSIIEHVTLQKIVVHDFRYDPRNIINRNMGHPLWCIISQLYVLFNLLLTLDKLLVSVILEAIFGPKIELFSLCTSTNSSSMHIDPVPAWCLVEDCFT